MKPDKPTPEEKWDEYLEEYWSDKDVEEKEDEDGSED
jgi:hypothetical protein